MQGRIDDNDLIRQDHRPILQASALQLKLQLSLNRHPASCLAPSRVSPPQPRRGLFTEKPYGILLPATRADKDPPQPISRPGRPSTQHLP